MNTEQPSNSDDDSDGYWIHAQEVESGKYFWVHSKTHALLYTKPPELNGDVSTANTSISRRQNTHKLCISPQGTIAKQKSLTPPPPHTHNLASMASRVSYKAPKSSSFRHSKRFKRASSSPKKQKKKHWFKTKSLRSQTEPDIDWNISKQNPSNQSLPNYVVLSEQNDPKTNKNNHRTKQRKLRAQSTIKPKHRGRLISLSKLPSTFMTKKDNSKYDIAPDADIDRILHELIGFDVLDINESIAKNEYIKSNILQFLAYRYQSLSVSHIKEFQPPLNDACEEIKYFRNIGYPQYPLDTNLKISQIIDQNIYDNQTPYLRIRIPLYINLNVFGNRNRHKSMKLSKVFGSTFDEDDDEDTDDKERKMNETFNIELSRDNVLSTTVRQFFHAVTKQLCSIKKDALLEDLLLGHNMNMNIDEDDEEEEYEILDDKIANKDWSKLAIKANGLEEYIFYSIDAKDKICNYECVRYALSHQLDKNDNKCHLTLVYLHDFDDKIEGLKNEYIEYGKYLNIWRKSIQQICFKQQFTTTYPWFDVINQQFNMKSGTDYMKMNDAVLEWKKEYDVRYSDNNIVFLDQYKCLFEYTIHSVVNTHKLPRFNRNKHSSIIISFELQIGSISYEQDIWLTPPKLPKKNKIMYKKAIYKSKHLRINTLPREVILSVIIFGIAKDIDEGDIYSVIYSSRSDDSSWFGCAADDESEHNEHNLIVREDPIDINLKFAPSNSNSEDEHKSGINCGPTSTRRRQYSYGKMSDDTDDDDDDDKGVFERAFAKCDPLGYLRIPLIDDFHVYRCGTFTFNLWDIPVWIESKHEARDRFGRDLLWRFIKPCSFPPHNCGDNKHNNRCEITISIGPNPDNNPDYDAPKCIAPLFNSVLMYNKAYKAVIEAPKETFLARDYKRMDGIVRRDPLSKLSKKERLFIWKCREKLSRTKPRGLPVFLQCVDWRNPYFRSEAYKYVYKWKMPNLLSDLVELLASWQFPDNRIKHFVINEALRKLSDVEIRHILLQLVQIIKIEPHNTSFTSSFVIQRALRSVTRIGHYLYWFLKTEIEANYTCYTRFTLILEDLLVHCFSYRRSLYVQQRIVDGLSAVSGIVCSGKKNNHNRDELCVRMQHILRRMNKSISAMCDGISIALNPKYKLKQLNIEKCKFMGSAQAPLWLVFTNYDIYSDEISVLFKCGDDLRQDLLTLQIMDTMNQLWLCSGFCMRLRIYSVITTGSTSGFIEIVTNARTFDDLSVNLGGGIVRGPKDETVHVKYLKSTHSAQHKQREMAQDRYLRSCAGYCIASWIIGIGDRHSDNIMLHECGDLFHIDFGHFLGHFKVKKFEIFKIKTEWNRERSPFVFLPAMKYCIKYDFKNDKVGCREDDTNSNYQRFVDLCTTAMDAIRRRHRLLLNLFALMLPSQMPELLSIKDIIYMRDQMQLRVHLNKQKVAIENYDAVRKYVTKELNDSVNDGVRIFDHIVHAYVHSK